ncbi:hypothetical protein FRX31_013139, partial [Thalictrum thalictroides]
RHIWQVQITQKYAWLFDSSTTTTNAAAFRTGGATVKSRQQLQQQQGKDAGWDEHLIRLQDCSKETGRIQTCMVSSFMADPTSLLALAGVCGYTLRKLKRNYKPTNVAIKNRGHDIMLRWICVCWNHLDQQY